MSEAVVSSEVEQAFVTLLMRHGATITPELGERAQRALRQLLDSLHEAANDGASLTPLDVARIRLGKFAATVLSPEVFRDARRLVPLRAEIAEFARGWLGDESGTKSRFALPKR